MPLIYLFCLSFDFTDSPKTTPRLKIAVLYFSPIDKKFFAALLQNIKATSCCTVTEINDVAAVPVGAYYTPCNRYRAPVLLTYLNTHTGYDKIIGITAKDISTKKDTIYDWGVMGLGNCPGMSCVISTFSLKTPSQQLFNDRFIKVALHELGPTMGLPHCTFSKTCFMEAAEGIIKCVDRETRFCAFIVGN